MIICRFTGDTCVNPAVGISIQLVAACVKGNPDIFFRDFYQLMVPSVLGAIVGSFFLIKFYEPMFLFMKHKDLIQ